MEYRKDKIMRIINTICEASVEGTVLKTEPFCRSCRYHKKKEQLFHSDQLFPRGFCPHAYRAIYPYALALQYNAQYPGEDGRLTNDLHIRCPGPDSYIDVKISVEYLYPRVIRKIKEAAVFFLHELNISAEYPDKNVIIEVCDVKGHCRYNVAKGSRFKFNLFNREELCPASFYALYPILVSSRSSQSFNSKAFGHCPDPSGIFYSIENRHFTCADFLKTNEVARGRRKKGPPGNLGKGDPGYDDTICPLAFYAVFPYYWTYIHAGKFEWVKRKERVSVQCVHLNGIVMEIELIRFEKPGSGAVKVEIIRADRDCAYDYQKGDVFVLDSNKQNIRHEHLINWIAESPVF